MTLGEIVTGQRQRWSLVKKLGEGDAGEVYLVESLLDRKPAILKRPYRSTFASDVLRQASQIRSEAKVLQVLEGVLAVSQRSHLHTPLVVDQSKVGTEFNENLFIIIEKAAGFDLNSYWRIARYDKSVMDDLSEVSDDQIRGFIENLARRGSIPELVLLRSLAGLIELFEIIHFYEFNIDSKRHHGIIWNDVKPDHLYWDPVKERLTVIDWGNSKLLEADGGTGDRHFSRLDDYSQFMQEMGKFLEDAKPELLKKLEWPAEIPPGSAFSEGVKPLKERIAAHLTATTEALNEVRRREADVTGTVKPELGMLDELASVQERLMNYGVIPDYSVAIKFHTRLAHQLSTENQLVDFRMVCEKAYDLASMTKAVNQEKWHLLLQIASLAEQADLDHQDGFTLALAAGVEDDWPTAIWELLNIIQDDAVPEWWDDISQAARRLHLKIDPDTLLPYVSISRLYYTLQAAVLGRSGVQQQRFDVPGNSSGEDQALQADPQTLLRTLEQEVVKKWKEIEPAPPDSGIEYNDIDNLVNEIETILPGTQQELDKTLAQPKAQARIVMDAWRGKEFDTGRRGLRNMLIWDPQRWRVLTAERAFRRASRWLLQVRQGAQGEEPFQDFLIQVELSGRELRNQVGPARWLDLILDTLKQLRSGARPADLIMLHPEILNEIPWLNEYRSVETITLPRSRELKLERDQDIPVIGQILYGMHEGTLGFDGDVHLAEPLDVWVPEARGSSARVFHGRLLDQARKPVPAAIKLMRADRADYAAPLFREEAQILSIMRSVTGVNRMLECGFIHLDEGSELPADDRHRSADDISGVVLRFGVEEIQNFLISLDVRIGQGWLPYLALEKMDPKENLMVYCDAGHTRGRFLPLSESLLLAIQICDILQVAHDRNIVYRDHKILHYYWNAGINGVNMIDWNIAKHYPQGLSSAEKKFDLVQFGARALHHIMTGRTAPGALPLGPNRPEEIEQASHSYHVQWTYDDERLPNTLKEILAETLSESYSEVRDLRLDLLEIYQQLQKASVENSDQISA
jgi:serine/threonine protein kinase